MSITIKEFCKKSKYIIMLILALLIGLVVELVCNKTMLKLPKEERGEIQYNLDELDVNGFEYSGEKLYSNANKSEDDEGKVVSDDENRFIATIVLNTNGRYVDKIKLNYETEARAIIRYVIIDSSNTENPMTWTDDYNNLYTDTTVQSIRAKCDQIIIQFRAVSDIVIKSISTYNNPLFNWRRFLLVVAGVFSIIFAILNAKWCYEKPEKMFVVLAIVLGATCALIVPAQKMGWDEGIHFKQAYAFFGVKDVGETVTGYMEDEGLWPLYPPQSAEEYTYENQYISEHASGTTDVAPTASISNVAGYMAPAIGMAIGRLLHMRFADIYVMGRFFQLALYIVIVYFAIKKLPVAKRLLMIMALMPTPMLMTSFYNRDAVIIPCAFLAASYLFYEFYETDKKITWTEYIVIMVSLFVVSLLKAVYAPLFAIVLLLPRDKFKDKKTCIIMKLGLILIGLLLVAVMIVPTLLNPNAGGDNRGLKNIEDEDTIISASGQLRYILGNPCTYIIILLKRIIKTCFVYTIGPYSWATLGHINIAENDVAGTYAILTVPIILLAILLDTDSKANNLKLKKRILIFAILGISVVLIWSAMYLSFTPVGYPTINGVQARYYIPLLLPLFLLFSYDKKHKFKRTDVCMEILVVLLMVMDYAMLYKDVIVQMCL